MGKNNVSVVIVIMYEFMGDIEVWWGNGMVFEEYWDVLVLIKEFSVES